VRTVLIDGDSIAYMAGWSPTLKDVGVAIDRLMTNILADTEADNYEMYIEVWEVKKTNFRMELATTKPYKGTRKKAQKPEFLNESREILRDSWNANLVNGMESEDKVLIRQGQIGYDKSIIAHIDKDLDQSPGFHYNYNHREKYTITPQEAHKKLWAQVLTGDSVDNIPGVKGWGKVKAETLVESTPLEDIPVAVARVYAQKGYHYGYLLEQGGLVYLLRSNNDRFNPVVTYEEYEQLLKEEDYLAKKESRKKARPNTQPTRVRPKHTLQESWEEEKGNPEDGGNAGYTLP